jgi:hypothetical protein
MHKIFSVISYLLVSSLFLSSSSQASRDYGEYEAEQEEVYPQQIRKRSRLDDRDTSLKTEKESVYYEEESKRVPAFVYRSVLLHLTPIFPKDGIMRAGALSEDKVIPSGQAMLSRSTLHFSWNGFSEYSMTEDRREKFFSRPYCIMERLQAVQNQLYGGNPYDVMVVGDYRLSENSLIIVPRSEFHELEQNKGLFKGEVIPYEHNETARDKAEQIMRNKNLPNIKLISGAFGPEWIVQVTYPTYYPCYSRPTEEDARCLLKSFFQGKYWGTHGSSPLGIVDNILIYLNHPFVFTHLGDHRIANRIVSPEEIERALILYDYHYQKLRSSQQGLPETLSARDSELRGWFNLIRKQLELSKKGCSIYENICIFKKLVKHKDDEDKISQICREEERFMRCSNDKVAFINAYKRDREIEVFNSEVLPITCQVVSIMAYEDVLGMIRTLSGHLFLDNRTLNSISKYSRHKNWRPKPLTEKEFYPLMKRENLN